MQVLHICPLFRLEILHSIPTLLSTGVFLNSKTGVRFLSKASSASVDMITCLFNIVC